MGSDITDARSTGDGKLVRLLFNPEGRINRAKWWGGLLAAWLIILVVMLPLAAVDVLTSDTFDPDRPGLFGEIATIILSITVCWISIVLGVKRFHDRSKSGWWVLIGCVPVVGPFWYLIECGFLPGTDGPNQHGPDPLMTGPAPSLGQARTT